MYVFIRFNPKTVLIQPNDYFEKNHGVYVNDVGNVRLFLFHEIL